MARIPYVDPAQASEKVRDTFERLAVPLNIFRMMAHAETCFRPMLRLGNAILTKQQLSAKLRELAILEVAQLSSAEYEWVQHVGIAEAAGASRDQIDALARRETSASCFDETEQLVLRFTDEVVRDAEASEATTAAMQKKFSSQEIVELIVAIGFYMMMARLMRTLAIDVDPPAGTRVVDGIPPKQA